MISLLFVIMNLIILLIYIKYPKKLHPIQASTCYMVSMIYTHDFLVIPSVNLKDWEMTKSVDLGLMISLNAVLAAPILIVLFIEIYESARNFLQKTMIFIVWVAIMLLFEYVHHWLRMIYLKDWNLNWSIMIWSILGIFVIIINNIIKTMIMKIGETS